MPPRRRRSPSDPLKEALAALPEAPFPERPPLMLCTLADDIPSSGDWAFEPKLDGLRVLAFCRPGATGKTPAIELFSRNDISQAKAFPDITAPLAAAVDADAVLDGEIVCLDESGRSSFRQLQQRFHLTREADILRRMPAYPAFFYVFDILHFAGHDLTQLTLRARRAVLEQAVVFAGKIRLTPQTVGDGAARFADACRNQEEGIVAKRLSSPYAGGRGGSWLKIKCIGRQEFVIGGWTEPQGSREALGALLVGTYDGKTLRYAGKVGTGFTDRVLRDLAERLAPLSRSTPPFAEGADDARRAGRGKPVHWVEPRLVAEIGFSEWTQHGLLRHPRYEGLRLDKPPSEVRRETAQRKRHNPT